MVKLNAIVVANVTNQRNFFLTMFVSALQIQLCSLMEPVLARSRQRLFKMANVFAHQIQYRY